MPQQRIETCKISQELFVAVYVINKYRKFTSFVVSCFILSYRYWHNLFVFNISHSGIEIYVPSCRYSITKYEKIREIH